MPDVANVITGGEESKVNRVCYFHFFDAVLASKGSNYSEHIYLHCSWCCAVRRPENVSSQIIIEQIIFSGPLLLFSLLLVI